MSKRKPKYRTDKSPHPQSAAPKIHVEIALAEADLHGAAALVKPALLYADTVTVYSPIATMINAITDFATIRDPQRQVDVMLDLIETVPKLAETSQLPMEQMQQLREFNALDRSQVRAAARLYGADKEINDFYARFGEIDTIWRDQMPGVLEQVRESTGAGELFTAIDAGAVKVADLGSSTTDIVSGALLAATGTRDDGSTEALINEFMTRMLSILGDSRSFPLLDAESSGLMQALDREGRLSTEPETWRRGTEITAAAAFMGYLPYFPELPIDEVLDLRRTLDKPLVRFRGALARLSRDFDSRPIDSDFKHEVEDAWRKDVAPALSDIREALAEHGFLKEVASVALGDARRLLVEAGGVFVAAHGTVLSLSALIAGASAAGVPVADLAAKAWGKTRGHKAETRTSAFYFLHQLELESAQRRRPERIAR